MLALLVFAACPEEPLVEVERPNFVVIDIDSMRADHMPLRRDGTLLTPNLERLAREGVSFTEAISQSGWTLPALMSLLSGRYPQGTMPPGGALVTLRLPERSLPEVLALYGYSTVGAWGVTLPSNDKAIQAAFQSSIAAPAVGEDTAVADWLAAAPKEPFFLYLHPIDLHATPASIPDTELHRWTEAHRHERKQQLHELFDDLEGRGVEKKAAIEHVRSHYDATLAWYDARLGRILDRLDSSGLAERTVVVFTSDHGEEFAEHGAVGHHGTHYENVLRIPLVWRDPSIAGGRSVDAMVQSIDLAPSILERAGIPADRTMDGKSWLPLAKGETEEAITEEVYSYSALEAVSLRTKRWKYAIHAGTCGTPTESAYQRCTELYNLQDDPGETRNLIDAEPARAAEMDAKLTEWMRDRVALDGAPKEDSALAQALKTGGYWKLVGGEETTTEERPASILQQGGLTETPAGPPVPDPAAPFPDGLAARPEDAVGPPEPTETPEERRARRQALRGR